MSTSAWNFTDEEVACSTVDDCTGNTDGEVRAGRMDLTTLAISRPPLHECASTAGQLSLAPAARARSVQQRPRSSVQQRPAASSSVRARSAQQRPIQVVQPVLNTHKQSVQVANAQKQSIQMANAHKQSKPQMANAHKQSNGQRP